MADNSDSKTAPRTRVVATKSAVHEDAKAEDGVVLGDEVPDEEPEEIGPFNPYDDVDEHEVFLCDGCMKALTETRLHCMECDETDYCDECAAVSESCKGHTLTRIRVRMVTEDQLRTAEDLANAIGELRITGHKIAMHTRDAEDETVEAEDDEEDL